ncbi:MAG: hypothetical protein DHS20C05_06000 [Hyphococcus sp.]|nr:MAG: hypothetical protein DHS20C05_06000 [Marinicaulis sp.]
MIYRFDDFELDTGKRELRRAGQEIAVEPQVFALLTLLAENNERLVSKDEIIEKIWDGRIVSESAVTSRVKSARQALGDTGKAQTYIRTVHGQGFRFAAPVKLIGAAISSGQSASTESVGKEEALNEDARRRQGAKPSIAVLPLSLVGDAGSYSTIADALPHELISELSRLRWLFVIARASSFRFRSADPDVKEIGAALGVRYCLSGVLEVFGDRVTITIELSDTKSGGVIWAERFSGNVGEVHTIREKIIMEVVAALEIQIPTNEAQAARLTAPENLDAWSAYHLGIQHLYRFNNNDNAQAAGLFERAVELEPGFARAHAGLSSAYFQNAFLKYTLEGNLDRKLARTHAEKSYELDPLDPFANFVMGRVHWIEDNIEGGIGWLDRSIALCPNYAQGIYARSWADTVSGRGEDGAQNISLALSLSPLDPFRYAMLGVRAFTHILRHEYQEGAYWADEAARAPGAHVLIAMIAVAAHGMNGNDERASKWAANVRNRNPDVTQKDFFRSFPFEDVDTRERTAKALGDYGF